ncbi:hypothetical protein HMI55_006427 [Coelomomyces lativittatus]|nr:hypothetical protein HMI55_006427 [Coelomomyces lativittatus]
MTDIQTERSFQKQHIFLNAKPVPGKKTVERWYRDVGLGFKTPKEAIELRPS